MLRAVIEEREIRRVLGLPETGERVVDGVATLDVAADRGLYFINQEVTDEVRERLASRSGCLVLAPVGSGRGAWGTCLVIECADPRAAMAKVLDFIRRERRQAPLVAARSISPEATISHLAVVEGDVEIGAGVVLEPYCVIGPDVRIGSGTIVRAGARIFPRVVIGSDCVIGAHAVLGHDGFGYVRDEHGNKTRIAHLGGVVIGDHVDLGAFASVPAGTILPTVVEDYAKVDDHVHVAHNVHLGRNATLTAGVVLAGQAEVGSEAWIGINASVRDGRRVGAHTLVGMDASIQEDLAEEAVARAPRPDVRARTDGERTAIGFSRRPNAPGPASKRR